MSKRVSGYAGIIKAAKRPANKKAGKPESQEPEEQANLSVKVPLRLRRHWASEAKREGTTLTAAITRALTERFGEPR